MKKIKLLLSSLLLVTVLDAEEIKSESSSYEMLTRTNLSFNLDKDGNLNPTLFIPVYYGSNNQFFSGIGYTSTNYNDVNSVEGFSDSKNAIVSSSHDLQINYITYQTSLFGLAVSIGAESTYTNQKNNEFGYIHDSANLFGKGTDYYIAFDNTVELDIYRHAIRADVLIPLGSYFTSRAFTSISPYTTIDVKQSTIFKPLVNETGTSSSSTSQDIAYNFRYEFQTTTGSFMDIGFVASYNFQPLKYDIAQLGVSGSSYVFEDTTIDTDEVTTKYLVKLIVNKEILGGLRPSLGYGVETLDRKNNLNGKITSVDTNTFTFGVEKRF